MFLFQNFSQMKKDFCRRAFLRATGNGYKIGGDEGDRTPDLGIANAALSHLSYIPTKN